MKMNKSRWKDFEREIARLFGTERTPLSGGNSKHTRSDTLHSVLFIECKKRKNHAVHSLFRDTEKLAVREGKIPLIATKETRKQLTLITLRIEDLLRIADEYRKINHGSK